MNIIGLGIDAVDIERCSTWHTFSYTTLRRFFSHNEIIYCLENPTKSAERFALRIAVKEAFYKAFPTKLPLRTVARALEFVRSPSFFLAVDWQLLGVSTHYKTLVSCTHTNHTAIATVLITT